MEADKDRDGKISFEEFTKMVENTDISMSMTLGKTKKTTSPKNPPMPSPCEAHEGRGLLSSVEVLADIRHADHYTRPVLIDSLKRRGVCSSLEACFGHGRAYMEISNGG